MDPNAVLARLRELVVEINNTHPDDDRTDHADEFAETFDGLDGWLSKGGFLPHDWLFHKSGTPCR